MRYSSRRRIGRKYKSRRVFKRRVPKFKKRVRAIARATIRRAAEVKYVAGLFANTTDTNNQYIQQQFVSIAQGVGVNQRVGNMITYKKIRLRGQLYLNRVSTTDTNNYFVRVRVILGYFKQETQYSSPVLSDFLQLTGNITNDNYINTDVNTELFKPIYDRTTFMVPLSEYSATGLNMCRFLNFSIPFRKTQTWKDTTIFPSYDVTTYPYLLIFTDQSTSGNVKMTISYQNVTSYIDV